MRTNLEISLKRLTCLAMALVLATPVLLQADQIYHWVDADGVNHYTQTPPPASTGGVDTLNVDGSQPASYDPNEDLYDVAGQAAATQAVRDKLAENKKNKQENQQNAAENTVIYYPQADEGYDFLYPPGNQLRPPNRPPNRPDGKPDRPTTLPEDTAPVSKPFRPRPR